MQHTDNSWHYAEDGLVIDLSLVAPESETQCIPVMKLSDVSSILYPGACTGNVYLVTSPKVPQEVLPADPRFSDGDSDSEDEEFSDEHKADTMDWNGKHLCSNGWRDARMDSKVLPEYLHPLMERLAEYPTFCGCEDWHGPSMNTELYSAVVLLTWANLT